MRDQGSDPAITYQNQDAQDLRFKYKWMNRFDYGSVSSLVCLDIRIRLTFSEEQYFYFSYVVWNLTWCSLIVHNRLRG